MKQTCAQWHLELMVECPHCEMISDVTNYISMSEIPCDIGKSNDSTEFQFECPVCHIVFEINTIIGW